MSSFVQVCSEPPPRPWTKTIWAMASSASLGRDSVVSPYGPLPPLFVANVGEVSSKEALDLARRLNVGDVKWRVRDASFDGAFSKTTDDAGLTE